MVERLRAVEETKLKMHTLKAKQELERQLELVQQRQTELNRKIELLNLESELKQAKIDLVIEQIPDDGIDGMDEYLNKIQNEDQTQPTLETRTAPEQPYPTQDERFSTTRKTYSTPVRTHPNLKQTYSISEYPRPSLD